MAKQALALALLMTAAPLACDRVGGRGGGPLNEEATTRISAARCTRWERCRTIGLGSRYTDREGCLQHQTVITRKELAPCARGVDEQRLEACVRAIGFNDCEEPTTYIGPLPACESAALCKK
jgi:hypothetical protein